MQLVQRRRKNTFFYTAKLSMKKRRKGNVRLPGSGHSTTETCVAEIVRQMLTVRREYGYGWAAHVQKEHAKRP
jgi:hypothetical protein